MVRIKDEVKTTVFFKNEIWDKIKTLAYWRQSTLKEIVNEIVTEYVKNYEETKGKLPTREQSKEILNQIDINRYL